MRNEMNEKLWGCFLTTFLFLGFANVLFAQPKKLHNPFEDNVYQRALLLLDEVQTHEGEKVRRDVSLFQVMNLLEYPFMQMDTLMGPLWDEKLKAEERELGLNFTARYQLNGDGDAEIFEPGSRYRTGLEWDILRDGFFDKKHSLQKIKNERRIYDLEENMMKRQKNYPYIYNKIIHAFNEERISLLKKRIPYLESYLEILTELYYNHDVEYIDIIEVKKKLEESKSLLTTYTKFNQSFERRVQQDSLILNAATLPIIDIQVDKLLYDTTHQYLMNEVVALKRERAILNGQKEKLPRFQVFSHYNLKTQSFEFDRDYLSFGARFSMPISWKKRQSIEKIQGLESEVLAQEADYMAYNNTREILNLYQEYNYKMKQYIAFLHTQARMEELIRVETVLLDFDKRGHSPLLALQYSLTKMEVETEMLDIRQMMYLGLAKIVTKSHHENIASCLKIREFEEVGKKLEGDRYVILDVKDLQENFVFTAEYLKKNELKTVIIPTNAPAILLQKLQEDEFNVIVADVGAIKKLDLLIVPTHKFHNRQHLEFWLSSALRAKKKSVFLFENLNELIALDRKNKKLITSEEF